MLKIENLLDVPVQLRLEDHKRMAVRDTAAYRGSFPQAIEANAYSRRTRSFNSYPYSCSISVWPVI